jgi:hypothetical protein
MDCRRDTNEILDCITPIKLLISFYSCNQSSRLWAAVRSADRRPGRRGRGAAHRGGTASRGGWDAQTGGHAQRLTRRNGRTGRGPPGAWGLSRLQSDALAAPGARGRHGDLFDGDGIEAGDLQAEMGFDRQHVSRRQPTRGRGPGFFERRSCRPPTERFVVLFSAPA